MTAPIRFFEAQGHKLPTQTHPPLDFVLRHPWLHAQKCVLHFCFIFIPRCLGRPRFAGLSSSHCGFTGLVPSQALSALLQRAPRFRFTVSYWCHFAGLISILRHTFILWRPLRINPLYAYIGNRHRKILVSVIN